MDSRIEPRRFSRPSGSHFRTGKSTRARWRRSLSALVNGGVKRVLVTRIGQEHFHVVSSGDCHRPSIIRRARCITIGRAALWPPKSGRSAFFVPVPRIFRWRRRRRFVFESFGREVERAIRCGGGWSSPIVERGGNDPEIRRADRRGRDGGRRPAQRGRRFGGSPGRLPCRPVSAMGAEFFRPYRRRFWGC